MTLLHPDVFLDRLMALAIGQRHLVALAGPPGAGKSTLAAALVARLNAIRPDRAAILPMDGYHFDDRVLAARGRLPRKGAPDTFDAGGLAAMLGRLRRNAEAEIAVPVFDRRIEIARAGAALIPRTVDIVLVEGNYLMIADPPWSALHPLFDLSALLRVTEETLRLRLLQRWYDHGLDADKADEKVAENDLPNGLFVLRNTGTVDLELDGTASLRPG